MAPGGTSGYGEANFVVSGTLTAMDAGVTNEGLEGYIAARLAECESIEPARLTELDELAAIVAELARDGAVPMIFICTHNSRRSHLAQVWAQVAANRFGLSEVETYSGGTEATAFHPNAVATLRRAGFEIEIEVPGANPRYVVSEGPGAEPRRCFSKVFTDAPNPETGFIAVMTCSDADRACPIVHGAERRVTLRYEDPKSFDGTDREAAAYDERNAQIARELLYLFDRVVALR